MNNIRKKIQIFFGCGLVSFLTVTFAGQAVAQTPPALQSATFYGGSGDQRGSAAVIYGPNIYISGFQQVSGLQGLLIRETVPPAGLAWTRVLENTQFDGLAVTASTIYPVGAAEAAHGASPGTCGAGDFVGDRERKGMFSRFAVNGDFLGCSSHNYFPYRGYEGYRTALAVTEDGTNFVYATGYAEQAGFASSLPFVMTKYTDVGAVVDSVTEPGIALETFGGCCPGDSNVLGLAEFDGHLYLAGKSRLPGFSEDNVTRPVLMKYSGLVRIWKARTNDVAGMYQSVVGLGGYMYVVGNALVSGQSDYLVAKYDALGTRIWSITSGGSEADVLTGIVAVGTRLFAVGYTTSIGIGGADVVVLEINPMTGATLSTTLFGGSLDEFANGVATDGTDIYVVGESRSFASDAMNSVGQNDVMLLRYTLVTDVSSTPEVCDGADNDLNDGVDEGFTDTDSDGTADCVDLDSDNDGVSNTEETKQNTDPLKADTDSDGFSDRVDNCPLVANNAQSDTDGDWIGDACDTLLPPRPAPTTTSVSPTVPSGLSASATSHEQITLTWTAPGSWMETGNFGLWLTLEVNNNTTGTYGGIYLIEAGISDTQSSHIASGLQPSRTYCYRIRGDQGGNTAYSNIACATTLPQPQPEPPPSGGGGGGGVMDPIASGITLGLASFIIIRRLSYKGQIGTEQ
jgi:hypothetical protein